MSAREQVILVDETGRAVGVAVKAVVHQATTPLHLAFSCYVFDGAGRLLVTRRARHKRTFPGVWTNSCCGHPAPGEEIGGTVHRRVRQELGVTLDDVRLLLPRFRYRAEMAGVEENELCPVFVATTNDAVHADPDEVDEHSWVDWPGWRAAVLDGSRDVSPWSRLQVAALPADPLAASEASWTELPAAAWG